MPIAYEVEGAVVRITIQRPEAKNALNLDAIVALQAALERANHESEARCVVVAGKGGDFSSGGDVKDMIARRGKAVATYHRLRQGLGSLVSTIVRHEKPVIAAVDGVCLGAGLGLALACDALIATHRSTFGTPFVKVGLAPDTGTSWLLPHIVGMQQARRLLLSGETLDAESAAGIGLVTQLVSDTQALASATQDLCQRFAALPPTAPRDAKRVLWTSMGLPLDSAVAHEAMMQGVRFTTDDHADAADAFLQRKGTS